MLGWVLKRIEFSNLFFEVFFFAKWIYCPSVIWHILFVCRLAKYVTSRMPTISFQHRPEPSVQFSSVAQSYPTLCDPTDCSMPGNPVHHQLPEFTQTHVHWVDDAIQPSHLLSSSSSPTFNLSQHQGLFRWVSSLHHVAKILAFQLQHHSFQWTVRTDCL